jgi:hypothetical protein
MLQVVCAVNDPCHFINSKHFRESPFLFLYRYCVNFNVFAKCLRKEVQSRVVNARLFMIGTPSCRVAYVLMTRHGSASCLTTRDCMYLYLPCLRNILTGEMRILLYIQIKRQIYFGVFRQF